MRAKELEHLKIKTRLINEKFASVMCECVTDHDNICAPLVRVMILLHQNKKRRESGKKCHTRTMMCSKPVKL